MPLGVLGLSRGRPFSPLSRAISARCSSITRCSAVMSPSKRMTSTFSSAGDRSSRFPGGDMPRQNLKSPYSESPDLPIFTRAVSPCPLQLSQAKSPLPGLLPLLPKKSNGKSNNNTEIKPPPLPSPRETSGSDEARHEDGWPRPGGGRSIYGSLSYGSPFWLAVRPGGVRKLIDFRTFW